MKSERSKKSGKNKDDEPVYLYFEAKEEDSSTSDEEVNELLGSIKDGKNPKRPKSVGATS